ncbi:MAG: hypothetical protein HZB41_06965 [Ignavibacteriae bacterium]|nr:hypothetical protein [Ignavibacteriota bacterium]
MRLIKVKYCIILILLFLNSCGTLFQGYFYNTKIYVPDNTHVYDTSNYEIPVFREPVYKTDDTAKYIELRTSDNQYLTFVLDSHYKQFVAKPKVNYLTLLSDAYMSIFCYGIPILVDFANGNMFKFDDINLSKDDFNLVVADTMNFVKIRDIRYKNKIEKDSALSKDQGFIMKDSRLSLFIGFGTNSLGWVVFLIPSHGAIGFKCKVVNGLDISFKADYNVFDEEYSAKYSGGVFRFTVEPRYYPFKDNSWYLSAGMNYFSTQFEKSFLRHDIIGPVFSHMYGVSVGAGYGGKWWFIDGAYSFGFERIRLEGENPFNLNYFTLGFYFNLPL